LPLGEGFAAEAGQNDESSTAASFGFWDSSFFRNSTFVIPSDGCWLANSLRIEACMWRLRILRERRREPELMDRPDMMGAPHEQALRGLERINAWSGSARLLWPAIAELARERTGKVIRILDVATGAGDLPIRLWMKARKSGLDVEIAGSDRSGSALEYASRRAHEKQAGVRFFEWDALRGPLPDGYDVVMSSLFLHHLATEEAIDYLRRMAAAARALVLVNDLRRGLAGLSLAWAGTRILSRSPVVHTDGVLSVRASFTPKEVKSMAAEAGLAEAVVSRRWPCRLLLSWRRA
jgi:2-polyprenyl-3-methyl-5-hydroxy-6-metoxy-1,4-benzoquinol methylase